MSADASRLAEATDAELEALIDALCPVLGIPVDPAFRPGIVANLRTTFRLAALVAAAPLDEREEPAPVYRP